MLNTPLVVRVCALLTLVVAKPVSDVPHFVCKDGDTIRRTLEMKGTRELTHLSTQIGEETKDAEDFHISIDMSQKLVVDDEVKDCAADRATKIERTYVTLEKSRTETRSGPSDSKTEHPETSDLQDKKVLFAWNAEKKAYSRTIDGEKSDLTENLEADMDYLPLLPAKDADAGAKWDVDFADVKTALLRPGGDIQFHGKTEVQPMDKRLRDGAWDALKGKLSLELGSPRDEDGKKLVTISFKGDMSYDAGVEREGEEKGPTKLHAEDAQKIEGKLEWDMQAGRAQSIEWTAKGQMKIAVSGAAKMPDGSNADFVQMMTFDEEYTYTGTFGPK